MDNRRGRRRLRVDDGLAAQIHRLQYARRNSGFLTERLTRSVLHFQSVTASQSSISETRWKTNRCSWSVCRVLGLFSQSRPAHYGSPRIRGGTSNGVFFTCLREPRSADARSACNHEVSWWTQQHAPCDSHRTSLLARSRVCHRRRVAASQLQPPTSPPFKISSSGKVLTESIQCL